MDTSPFSYRALWLMVLCTAFFDVLPLGAQSGDDVKQSGDFKYTSDGKIVTITGYAGSGGVVTVPDVIDMLPVRTIGGNAFASKATLTHVVIGRGVTSIEDGAFYSCTGLRQIDVAADNSAYRAVDGVLFDAGQTRLIHYPAGRTGDYTIPDTIVSINKGAFFECKGLTRVAMGTRVTSIGDAAFAHCATLRHIDVAAGNPAYLGEDGVLFDAGRTRLIQYPGGKAGDYTVPDSVTAIEKGAFFGCAGLTGLIIGRGVAVIGEQAFIGCATLRHIAVAAGHSTYHSAGGVLFDKNQTRLIQYPAGKTGDYMIPDNVTSIDAAAFFGCVGLTGVTIPHRVVSIGAGAFTSCLNLPHVTIPDSVVSLGNKAFSSCTGLTRVTIGDGVTSIDDMAFALCLGLTDVTVGQRVASLGGYAFAGCQSLTTVIFKGNAPKLGETPFSHTPPGCTIVFRPGATGFTAPAWQGRRTRVEVPAAVGSSSAGLVSWTSQDGKVIRAAFVKLAGETVVVRREDGKEFTIPFTRLSPESVAQARSLARTATGK